QRPKPPAHTEQPAAPKAPSATPAPSQGAIGAPATASQQGESIVITTDLVVAEIDTLGGTLKRLELLKHKDSNDSEKNFVLISPAHQYEAQSGLAGEGGPTHRSLWKAEAGARTLAPGSDSIDLRLTAQGKDGIEA